MTDNPLSLASSFMPVEKMCASMSVAVATLPIEFVDPSLE
jgi:hypothetical protein